MAPTRLGPVESVQQFMEAVWGMPPKPNAGARVFRGQTHDWPLLPKLFRNALDNNSLGELEGWFLDEFSRRCIYLLPSVPQLLYDTMSLAQHYGLPTRLLDWSHNPLMALFFAVESDDALSPIVWIFDATCDHLAAARSLDRSLILDLDATILIKPATHSQRVVSQTGWHTVHSLGRKSGRGIRDMMDEESAHLSSIAIATGLTTKIRHELRDMGIHAATVYGDLNSVCREIENDTTFPRGSKEWHFPSET